jgi:hypothetical protein
MDCRFKTNENGDFCPSNCNMVTLGLKDEKEGIKPPPL